MCGLVDQFAIMKKAIKKLEIFMNYSVIIFQTLFLFQTKIFENWNLLF